MPEPPSIPLWQQFLENTPAWVLFRRGTCVTLLEPGDNLTRQAVAQLASLAQEVRETMHDMDNKEPNVTPDNLRDILAHFEQALDKALQAVLQEAHKPTDGLFFF